jgi:hypothetical protein
VVGDQREHRAGPGSAAACLVHPGQPGRDRGDVHLGQAGGAGQLAPGVWPADSPQADAVDRHGRITAQVGKQLADARVPGLTGLDGVHRRWLDHVHRLDLDHVGPGAVVVARHHLAALPAPEGQDDRP